MGNDYACKMSAVLFCAFCLHLGMPFCLRVDRLGHVALLFGLYACVFWMHWLYIFGRAICMPKTVFILACSSVLWLLQKAWKIHAVLFCAFVCILACRSVWIFLHALGRSCPSCWDVVCICILHALAMHFWAYFIHAQGLQTALLCLLPFCRQFARVLQHFRQTLASRTHRACKLRCCACLLFACM